MSRDFIRLYRGVSGVYKITNKLTGEFYIGASGNIGRRWTQHLACTTLEIQRDIQKLGPENFTFEVVEQVARENLPERETYWIRELKPAYNREGAGGHPGKPLSVSARTKISENNRVRTYKSDMSEARKARVLGEEWRKHMSESRKKKYKYLLPDGTVKLMNNHIASRDYINKGIKVIKLD